MTDRPRVADQIAMSTWGAGLSAQAREALAQHMVRHDLPDGGVLVREGEAGDMMYLVVSGRLRISTRAEGGGESIIGEAGTGDLVGEMSILSAQPRNATVVALEPTHTLRLSSGDLQLITPEFPEILDGLHALVARRAQAPGARRYRPETSWILGFLREIDFFAGMEEPALRELERQMRWVAVLAGETLMHQGAPATDAYLLVSGRLRVTVARSGADPLTRDLHPGELVGEMALIGENLRSATVQAVRDCELLAMPRDQVVQLARHYPSMLMGMLRMLTARLRTIGQTRARGPSALNLAILGIGTRDLPELCARISTAITAWRPVVHLTRQRYEALGYTASDLGQLEEGDRVVIYEADLEPSSWSRFCLRQADVVLLIGRAGSPPPPGGVTLALADRLALAAPPRVELVLLHPSDQVLPKGTADWLDRVPVQGHHHVRADQPEDWARMIRLITGRATAVVLSGGGARGFAHIGVLRALDEAGVTVDAVAGTSMGSVIAAQRALGWSWQRMVEENYNGWVKAKPMTDYRLPLVSLLSGKRFFAMLEGMFGGMQIEDLWLPFFCATANMNSATPFYASRGELWRWITASVGIPGLGPPRILNGDFHCDGGVLDNLPVVQMRRTRDAYLLAVDVSEEKFPIPPPGVTEFPSSWQLLRQKVSGEAADPMPQLFEILFRSATMAADHKVAEARAEADLCFQPPVSDFQTFRFDLIEQIVEAGYAHARAQLAEGALWWQARKPAGGLD